MLFQLLAMCEEVTVEEVLKLVDAHLQPHKGIRGTVSIVVSFLFSLSLINHSLSVSSFLPSHPFFLPYRYVHPTQEEKGVYFGRFFALSAIFLSGRLTLEVYTVLRDTCTIIVEILNINHHWLTNFSYSRLNATE